MKKRMLPLLAITLLSGCAGHQVKLAEYNPAQLKEADIMPSKAELAGKPMKVVVLGAKDAHIKMAKSAEVGLTVANAIEAQLGKTGVELVDRSIAGKLGDEIALAEMKGSRGYKGPEVSDFVITGNITKANTATDFTEARSGRDSKGNYYQIAATCSFSATVAGNVKIYQVPSLQLVKTIDVESTRSNTRETRTSYCDFPAAEQESLLREAAVSSVEKSRDVLQNYFAPHGYVLERRDSKSKSVFKVTLGSRQGAAPKGDVVFVQKTASNNPLTGEKSVEEYEVATGVVSDQLGPQFAWIVVDDKEAADKIRLGDTVKLAFKIGMFEKVVNFTR